MPQHRDLPHSPYESLKFFRARLSLIERAPFGTKSDHEGVSPVSFVDWALSKRLEVPTEMIQAVEAGPPPQRPKMLSSVDKRKYDSALKVILGLLSAQFGYQGGPITSEMRTDIASGLAVLGLSLDPKTLGRTLNEAITNRKRFDEEQQRRDVKDI